MKDGNNEQLVKTGHKNDATLNLEGKTDDEIKKAIIEDMKKNGTDVKPEDLKIERDADGHVKVEFTKVNDSKERKMEKESLNGQKTIIASKENFRTTTFMALEPSNGVTAAFMKVIG